jgi:hypothetical protein
VYDTDRYGTTVCCISSSKLQAAKFYFLPIQKFNIELQVEGVPYGTRNNKLIDDQMLAGRSTYSYPGPGTGTFFI